MTKINELEEQIKLLNLENESLVERVEEIEIIALVSKSFEYAQSVEEVYEIVLEKVSIMKTVPYCGIFSIKKSNPNMEAEYSYLSNDANLINSYSIQNNILENLKSEKQLYIDSKMKDFDEIRIEFSDKYFIPDCYLLIPFNLLNHEGFFLFADNSIEQDLESFAVFLAQIVHLTKSKVTNILLLKEIVRQNDNLAQLVEEKSTELYESEAKYKELIEHVPDAIVIHHKGRIEYVNPWSIKLFEAESESDLIGRNIIDFVADGYKENALKNIDFVLLGNQNMRTDFAEYEVTTLKGNSIFVEASGTKFYQLGDDRIQLIVRNITKRKMQDQNLVESEKKFRMLFDNAAVGLALLDLRGNVINANESALEIFELNRNEIVGKSGLPLFNIEKRSDLIHKFSDVFLKKRVKLENEYMSPKGEKKYLEFLGSKLSENRIIVSINDLTEKRQSALKVKASERKFKSLIEQSPIGIVISQDGKVVFANKVLVKMLGYKELKDVYGKNSIDFVHPDFVEIVKKRLKILSVSGGVVNSLEEKFISTDGRTLDVLVFGQRIEYEGKQAIQTYIFDLTEDKKLIDENRVLKAGIECINDTAVMVLNTDSCINYINPGFTHIYGYKEEEALGKHISIIKSHVMNEEFHTAFEKNILAHNSFAGELINRTKSGKDIIVDVSLTPIFSHDDRFQGYIEIHKDITERREKEAELLKAKKAAEQADKVKSEFLAQMSHEIRTPINAIVSFSGLLKEELKDIVSDDLKTSFSLIDRAGHRIIRTVDLLLNLSEIHTGTYQCILKKLNLYEDVVSAVFVNYKYLAKQKNLAIELKINTDNLMITADAYALEQIFKNLIDNAIKYTLKGKVEVLISRENSKLTVVISDTGVGISKEYLPKLFEPFSQEETGYTRSFEGNGIGLALVKEYSKLNNVAINVESEKGEGTTVKLTFAD